MPLSIQALRERRNDLAKQANNQLANKGDAIWSPADKTAFDEIANQIDAVDSQIEATQRLLNLNAEQRFEDAPIVNPQDTEKNSRRKVLDKLLRNGLSAMSKEEMAQIRNTMSVGTGNQGGYTVQSDVASDLVETIATYRGMRDEASRIVTASGGPLSYPTSDGSSEEGEIVAENASSASSDITFGTAPLNTFKFGSKIITVPIELLQDTSIDIIALINKRIRDRVGRIQNKKFTIGAGTTEPFGVTVSASVGKVGTTGQTVTFIYDDLIDLQESIDAAYDDGTQCFMMSQSARKVARKIKDTSGRPIWIPSYDASIAGGKCDQLLGADVCLNNHMPTPAANAKSIAYGQIGQYMIRDTLDVTIFRFEDSAYMSKGQVGFLAWARAGGNLLDTGAVKTYQHSAT
jgi:HK97 family phage major capsid protein